MRRTTTATLAALAIGAALATASSLYAQDTPGAAKPPMDHGMMGSGMMGGDMAGMMKMMQSMNSMMDACSKMMQSAATPQAPDPNQPRTTPPAR